MRGEYFLASSESRSFFRSFKMERPDRPTWSHQLLRAWGDAHLFNRHPGSLAIEHFNWIGIPRSDGGSFCVSLLHEVHKDHRGTLALCEFVHVFGIA